MVGRYGWQNWACCQGRSKLRIQRITARVILMPLTVFLLSGCGPWAYGAGILACAFLEGVVQGVRSHRNSVGSQSEPIDIGSQSESVDTNSQFKPIDTDFHSAIIRKVVREIGTEVPYGSIVLERWDGTIWILKPSLGSFPVWVFSSIGLREEIFVKFNGSLSATLVNKAGEVVQYEPLLRIK